MYSFGEKFRAWLATGRVANLPTVWSNVLVAFLISLQIDALPYTISTQAPQFSSSTSYAIVTVSLGMLIASLLYVGGCMLGDYVDTPFDQQHKPNRPLPQGVLSGASVFITSLVFIALAMILAIVATPLSAIIGFEADLDILQSIPLETYLQSYEPNQILSAFILTTLIITYACTHKKNRLWGLTNMASCRAALILFAITLSSSPLYYLEINQSFHTAHLHPPLIFLALAVGLYTFLLSSVAATESSPETFSHRKLLGLGLAVLPLFAIPFLRAIDAPHSLLSFLLLYPIYLAWMVYSFAILTDSKPAFVSNALAGFCLLDACFAATFSLPVALICLGLFGLALLFQKISAAT